MASQWTGLALAGLIAVASAPVAAQTGFGALMGAPVPDVLLAQSTCVSMGLQANLMVPFQIIEDFDLTTGGATPTITSVSRATEAGPSLTATLERGSPRRFRYECAFVLEGWPSQDVARVWQAVTVLEGMQDQLEAAGLTEALWQEDRVELSYCLYAWDYAPHWVAHYTETFDYADQTRLAYSVTMTLAVHDQDTCTPANIL